MDAAGAALYQQQQINDYASFLKKNLLCNTHSVSESADASEMRIEKARQQILRFLNANSSEYIALIYKSTRLAAESHAQWFRISEQSKFIYGRTAHNSIIGMRSSFVHWYQMMPSSYESMNVPKEQIVYADGEDETQSLLALPAKENFAGTLSDLRIF